MGLEQYSYSEGDAAWWATFLARCERQSKGFIGLSLTNFTTSTVCAVAAGSVVEIDGAIFIASAETSVSGSIATGLNYIICSVTDTTASPYWSQTAASTWDTAKQGFYHAAERYVAGCASDGTTYDNKWVYEEIRPVAGDTPYATLPKVKIGNDTRNASGLQVITGIGFRPSAMILLTSDDAAGQLHWSVGFDDSIDHMCLMLRSGGTVFMIHSTYSLSIFRDTSNILSGYVSAKSDDGFTIDWDLTGTCAVDFTFLYQPSIVIHYPYKLYLW